MRIIIRANSEQKAAMMAKPFPHGAEVEWYGATDFIEEAEGDVFFDLLYDQHHLSGNLFVKGKLVFANAVLTPTTEMKYRNHVRLNGWPGFLEREALEIACSDEARVQQATELLQRLGWRFHRVPDLPGMVSPRIVAMIVNEAFYGLGDNISSRDEIDTAMKLGTNYPYGPFEWAQKIGIARIVALLSRLAQDDPRYTPAPLLLTEAENR